MKKMKGKTMKKIVKPESWMRRVQHFDKGTWIQSEEAAYPSGGETRKGVAVWEDDGVARVIWGGIPDTYFTIPAHGSRKGKHVRGYLSADSDDGDWTEAAVLVFHPNKK